MADELIIPEALKIRLTAVIARYKKALCEKINLLDRATSEVASLRERAKCYESQFKSYKHENARLYEELTPLRKQLEDCAESGQNIETYNQLKSEVVLLRQKVVLLESEKTEAVKEFSRKTEFLDLIQKGHVDGKVDIRKLEADFAQIKKENGSLKARMAQQDGLIENLKREETRLKAKVKTLR